MTSDNERIRTDPEGLTETERYRRLSILEISPRSGVKEDMRTTPLMTLAVKDAVDKDSRSSIQNDNAQSISRMFDQYAVLGFHSGCRSELSYNEPILMNVNAPHSAFICGSQGSGKSYTLSCMLENCLIADERIGQVHQPLAGLAFHFDPDSAGGVAEAAYICSLDIRVNVLVSQSNETTLRATYSQIPGVKDNLSVMPLLFRSRDLSIERMHRLMAFSDKESGMPLYMSVALRVLRQMAIDTGGGAFNYLAFKKALDRESLTKEQLGPLNLRLELLESYLDLSPVGKKKSSGSLFDIEAGTLTIIDLTDPFMDPATACILFDICLSLVKERSRTCGLVVTLDEAHKYMSSSLAASNFTEKLLSTIREQRHNATRVIIATQEPTVSEKLLDLCSVSIIHRFTSPAWFTSIQNHLGAASKAGHSVLEQHAIFKKIMDLSVGESLVFAPSAFVCLRENEAPTKLGGVAINMKTRTRLGADGGMSVLTSMQIKSPLSEEIGRQPFSTRQKTISDPTELESRNDGNVTQMRPQVTDTNQTGGGILLASSNAVSSGEKDAQMLDSERSHLVLICCSCEKIVLIEFCAYFLPELTDIDQGKSRSGVAYATCAVCRLEHIEDTKKASKQYDFARSKEFSSGAIKVNERLRQTLLFALRRALNHDSTVLSRDGQPLYLFSRLAQRVITSRDRVWMLRLVLDPAECDCTSVDISPHKDGIFFKASLQHTKNTV